MGVNITCVSEVQFLQLLKTQAILILNFIGPHRYDYLFMTYGENFSGNSSRNETKFSRRNEYSILKSLSKIARSSKPFRLEQDKVDS